MSCLHIVNKSPYSHHALDQCLASMQADDAIILIEDGVFAVTGFYFDDAQKKYPLTENIFVLGADIDARGLALNSKLIKKVDYAEFVNLAVSHQNSLSWF